MKILGWSCELIISHIDRSHLDLSIFHCPYNWYPRLRWSPTQPCVGERDPYSWAACWHGSHEIGWINGENDQRFIEWLGFYLTARYFWVDLWLARWLKTVHLQLKMGISRASYVSKVRKCSHHRGKWLNTCFESRLELLSRGYITSKTLDSPKWNYLLSLRRPT